jgi:cob(I)alamin adenosyltransferase
MTGAGQPPISTKTGDDGTTGLLLGGRVSKADPVIEICGALDEAVAALGLARAFAEDDAAAQRILRVQRGLFVVAADVAADPRRRDRLVPGVSETTADMTAALEEETDALVARRPLRTVFVVPGANPASAGLDLARTAVRRAERRAVAARDGGTPVSAPVLTYLNRASDLLFVLARHAAGEVEEPVSHD